METRTAAKAAREVTARYPEMKVIEVVRVTPTAASIKAALREPDAAEGADPKVLPFKRVS